MLTVATFLWISLSPKSSLACWRGAFTSDGTNEFSASGAPFMSPMDRVTRQLSMIPQPSNTTSDFSVNTFMDVRAGSEMLFPFTMLTNFP